MTNNNTDKYLISVSLLRILAIFLITNTHMNNVYPTESLAVGGFIGDVLFFLISGFGLYRKKSESFLEWYSSRLIRIYPIVWVCTIIFTILGFYDFNTNTVISQYIYPTNFHFVGSIVFLYIFYYLFVLGKDKKQLLYISLIVFVIWIASYIFIYDKTFYHIDAVEEWMARFIFFEAMICGAFIKMNISKISLINNKKNHIILLSFLPFSAAFYFVSKIGFSKKLFNMNLQILNQFTVFLLVINITTLFLSYNSQLEIRLKKIKKHLIALSMRSLEIYIVQKPIIEYFETMAFPINLIIIITCIAISVYSLILINRLVIKKLFLYVRRN